MFGAAPPSAPAPPEEPAPLGRYALAVAITVAAILSQYVVPEDLPVLLPVYSSLLGGVAIVYGIPLLAFALAVGAGPLRRWAANPGRAVWEGLRWYALLTLLALLVVGVLTAIYLRYDPQVVQLLSKPNPVLQSAASDPWFWVGFSFAIGAVEETIFRGYIFGYWLRKDPDRWFGHAVWTSALFAGVHLYYGSTYAAASPIIYADLFLLGIAFCGAVRAAGGNLWVVALLHGAHDAAAFLTLVNEPLALLVAYGVVAVGAVIAVVDLAWTTQPSRVPPPPPGSDPLVSPCRLSSSRR